MQDSPNGTALPRSFILRKHAHPDNPEVAASNEDKSRASACTTLGNGFARFRVLTSPLSALHRDDFPVFSILLSRQETLMRVK